MRIAILGATSQIAKDLVLSFAAQNTHELSLYARRPEVASTWLVANGLLGRYQVADFSAFCLDTHFDAIINFVGVGNPVQIAEMGASIFDVTLNYDEMALDYVRQHTKCRYIFLSSGAAYGSNFDKPVDENTKAAIPINNLQPQDWYGVAKLHAECRHRAQPHLPIVDIRVFNYFSHTQDMAARYLITDIMRAIRDKTVLKTSAAPMVRDYINPSDFNRLIGAILDSPATNATVDCYTKAPIEKITLLSVLQSRFNLNYEVVPTAVGIAATGRKPNYYSLNRRAEGFGYQSRLTSLDGIEKEIRNFLEEAQAV